MYASRMNARSRVNCVLFVALFRGSYEVLFASNREFVVKSKARQGSVTESVEPPVAEETCLKVTEGFFARRAVRVVVLRRYICAVLFHVMPNASSKSLYVPSGNQMF